MSAYSDWLKRRDAGIQALGVSTVDPVSRYYMDLGFGANPGVDAPGLTEEVARARDKWNQDWANAAMKWRSGLSAADLADYDAHISGHNSSISKAGNIVKAGALGTIGAVGLGSALTAAGLIGGGAAAPAAGSAAETAALADMAGGLLPEYGTTAAYNAGIGGGIGTLSGAGLELAPGMSTPLAPLSPTAVPPGLALVPEAVGGALSGVGGAGSLLGSAGSAATGVLDWMKANPGLTSLLGGALATAGSSGSGGGGGSTAQPTYAPQPGLTVGALRQLQPAQAEGLFSAASPVGYRNSGLGRFGAWGGTYTPGQGTAVWGR